MPTREQLLFEIEVWERYHLSRAAFFQTLAKFAAGFNLALVIFSLGLIASELYTFATVVLFLLVVNIATEFCIGGHQDWLVPSWNSRILFHREIYKKLIELQINLGKNADLSGEFIEFNSLRKKEEFPYMGAYFFARRATVEVDGNEYPGPTPTGWRGLFSHFLRLGHLGVPPMAEHSRFGLV